MYFIVSIDRHITRRMKSDIEINIEGEVEYYYLSTPIIMKVLEEYIRRMSRDVSNDFIDFYKIQLEKLSSLTEYIEECINIYSRYVLFDGFEIRLVEKKNQQEQ